MLMRSKLGRKMEFYFWEILLCHLKNIARIGKKHITFVFIQSHILVFAFFEISQLCKLIWQANRNEP